MRKVRIAVIGCGDIAGDMMTVFKLTCGVSAVDFCDADEKRALKQAARFGVRNVYTDYNEMIEKTAAEAVYIALPHFLHYPVMKKALEHGKHILCEKPITIRTEDAIEINALAEESGLKIAVNYQYRYDANCHRLAKAVLNGDLGRILFIRCLMPWSRDESYFTKSPWHASLEKSGGGTLITQGSHLLDIILWMTGCGVKSAEAVCRQLKFRETEVEDFCSAEIILENGTPVQFTCTMAVPVEKEIRLEVYGEKGCGVYTKLKGSGLKFHGVRPPKYGYGKPAVHAVQKSLRDFRDSILSGKEHLCPGSEAVRVLEAVNLIYSKAKGVRSEGI